MENKLVSKLKILPRFIWILVLSLFSLSLELAPWVLVLTALLLFSKAFLENPPKWATGALAVGVLGLVYSQFGTFLGRDPATHFLTLLTAIKILEFSGKRDEKFLFLLGLFTIVSKFLFSIDLFVFIIQILLLYFYLEAFLSHNSKVRFHSFLLKQMLYSLPLTIALFIFFPRLNYNFSTLDRPTSSSGFSGFSDEMSPGDVSKVVQTDDLVLRAQILNTTLSSENLYWRGEVLEINSGFSWKKNQDGDHPNKFFSVSKPLFSRSSLRNTSIQNELFSYSVVLEPHGRNWVFSLDRPVEVEGEFIIPRREQSGIFQFQFPIKRRMSYSGKATSESFIDPERQSRLDELIQSEVTSETTKFPDYLVEVDELDAEIVDFIKNLKSEISKAYSKGFDETSRLQRVRKILQVFQESDFKYTLEPPAGTDTLSNFLLKNKQGYCEHFSSAFTILARTLGVPARIVVGYYGGEYNSYGDFWKVTQKNAHAWSEILLENGKWLRIDPTSSIGSANNTLAQINLSQSRRQQESSLLTLWNDFQLTLDVINFRWTTFLLDFDLENQQEIFSLVVQYFQNISVIFGVLIGLFFLFKYFRRAFLHKQSLQQIEGVYKEYSSITGRPPALGPMTWHEKLISEKPQLEESSKEITLAYVRKSYLPRSTSRMVSASLRHHLEEIRDSYKESSKASALFNKK